LEQFGERVGTSINILGRECELNPPRLEQYDAWGKRVDRLITCSAWKELKSISAKEGLIAIAYERKYGEWRYAEFVI
jgi:Adaptive response protein AidB N-terminal domain